MADSTSLLADAPQASIAAPRLERHHLYEDAIAMLIGTSFIGLSITFYSHAMLMTGSMAGIALLIQYATGIQFGLLYFLINLPFYYFAVKRMGWAFTIRTFVAVALMAGFARIIPLCVDFSAISPLFAALMGGTLMGMGVLALFRHRSGVGGVNILALYLQDVYGIRAGWFQLGLDFLIMLAALFFIPLENMLLSLVGAVAMNVIIAINHKPGRYLATS